MVGDMIGTFLKKILRWLSIKSLVGRVEEKSSCHSFFYTINWCPAWPVLFSLMLKQLAHIKREKEEVVAKQFEKGRLWLHKRSADSDYPQNARFEKKLLKPATMHTIIFNQNW